jgi:hypothetical protein
MKKKLIKYTVINILCYFEVNEVNSNLILMLDGFGIHVLIEQKSTSSIFNIIIKIEIFINIFLKIIC